MLAKLIVKNLSCSQEQSAEIMELIEVLNKADDDSVISAEIRQRVDAVLGSE